MPLPFIESYVEGLNESLGTHSPSRKLSRGQRAWLKFCLMGILLTNTVCWAAFERAGWGEYRLGALSWMFRRSKLAWDLLWQASVSWVLHQHGITDGVLVADDSDHQRAKRTRRIHGAHKIFDKKTSGYFNGQTLVFLLLVTSKVTVPVGFRFYRPDPQQRAWRQEERRLKRLGVKKSHRPLAPERNPAYPSKADLVLTLIGEFRCAHPEVTIKAALADALYNTQAFMDEASRRCGGVQVITRSSSFQCLTLPGKG